MKKKTLNVVVILSLSILILATTSCKKAKDSGNDDIYDLAGIEASSKVKDLIKNDILKFVNNDVIIKEISSANEKNSNRTEAEIKKIDEEWQKATTLTETMTKYLTNPAAVFIKEKVKSSNGKYTEIFVMDQQGCNVAMSSKTSDFYQGDEAKFQKSYNNGKGAVFADKVKFDESTKTSSSQISLPVVDPSTKKVIGAITVGIDIESL